MEQKIDKSNLTEKEKATVYQEAERCKIALSSEEEVSKVILLQEKKYTMHMTNQQLIHISKELFRRMQEPLERALNNSGLAPEE